VCICTRGCSACSACSACSSCSSCFSSSSSSCFFPQGSLVVRLLKTFNKVRTYNRHPYQITEIEAEFK
jgi:hypothetical protein